MLTSAFFSQDHFPRNEYFYIDLGIGLHLLLGLLLLNQFQKLLNQKSLFHSILLVKIKGRNFYLGIFMTYHYILTEFCCFFKYFSTVPHFKCLHFIDDTFCLANKNFQRYNWRHSTAIHQRLESEIENIHWLTYQTSAKI